MLSLTTIIGLINYDDSLFNNLVVPESIDRDTLIKNIIVECGDFPLLYPNADFMKSAIDLFSKKYYDTFKKWSEALAAEYNPLENYDRKELWSDSGDSSGTDSSSGTNASTSTSSTQNDVSAYDSGTFNPKDKTISNDGINSTNSNTGSTSNQFANAHEGRIHGNIGVTTSQQMLESELKLRRWNLIQQITDLFINEFCIPIYS